MVSYLFRSNDSQGKSKSTFTPVQTDSGESSYVLFLAQCLLTLFRSVEFHELLQMDGPLCELVKCLHTMYMNVIGSTCQQRIELIVDIVSQMLEPFEGSINHHDPCDYTLFRYFVFTTVNHDGLFKQTSLITKNIAAIEYWSRLAVLFLNLRDRKCQRHDLVGKGTVLDFLFQVKGLGMLFQKDEGRMSECQWANDALDHHTYDKVSLSCGSFTIPQFAEMVQKMVNDVKEEILALTFNHTRAEYIDLKILQDQVNLRQPGYSCFSDSNNRVLNEIRNEVVSLGMVYLTVDGQDLDTIHYDQFQVNQWLDRCEKMTTKLGALYHISSGQPARGTELQRLQFQDLPNRARNLFVSPDGEMFTLSYYNKTDSMTNSRKHIFRYIHSSVAQLLGQYLGYVRPLEE